MWLELDVSEEEMRQPRNTYSSAWVFWDGLELTEIQSSLLIVGFLLCNACSCCWHGMAASLGNRHQLWKTKQDCFSVVAVAAAFYFRWKLDLLTFLCNDVHKLKKYIFISNKGTIFTIFFR